MKYFLTGASGILGTDILKQLERNNQEILHFNSSNISLSDYKDVCKKIFDFKPDVVLHCAAMTNVDLCEDDRLAALQTNVIGSQNVAIATNKLNAKLVYISSCGVYGNGKLEPYNELDVPNPLNFHHYTKLEGENRIKEHHNDFIIVRPGWLFGGTTEHKKNFVEARRKESLTANVLSSAVDKVGSPTYTFELARQILHIIDSDLAGTFNVVNQGRASRFDYVTEIIKLLGLSVEVKPVNSNEFPRKANMPDNECLDNMNLNLHNLNLMSDWKIALKDYITTTYN